MLGRNMARKEPAAAADTRDDFRAFTFVNAVKLWGTQNPRFFEGTRVVKEAAAILAAAQTPPSPPPPSNPGTAAPPHGGAVSLAGVGLDVWYLGSRRCLSSV
jgi:hypothetical protein